MPDRRPDCHPNSPHAGRGLCRACYMRQYPRNPRDRQFAKLKHHYGLTPEQFDALLCAQQGRCDICSKPLRKLHVDHSHKTGDVRALLCAACNLGIGTFEEEPERLRAAAAYIERHA